MIGAEIDVDDEGVYTKLQEELKRAEFHPSENRSFAWERRVDGVRVVLEFFCQAEPDGAPGRLKRNPGGEVGSGVSAVQLKGAEIAAADCTARILSGDVLDHGGHREVEVQVVEVAKAMAILEERFAELDRKGPSKCARFFLGGRDDADEDRVRLRRDARGTVRAFLTRWKELRCSRL